MGSLLGGIIFVVQVIGNLLLNIFKFPATKIKILFVWERGKTQPKKEKENPNIIQWTEKKEVLPELDSLGPFKKYSFKKDGKNES